MRQIILDTETTGIRVEDGHRVIEIGCVEMIDRKLTGHHYHQYINPLREVELGALQVHGISNEFLQDKPLFDSIVDDFMTFIAGAELIIHNAPFDVGFLNAELKQARHPVWRSIQAHCTVVDTLQLARQRHVGQRNTLDALCKRYGVDNTKRELHGALLDAHLLAQVYLAMTGGQGNFFESLSEDATTQQVSATSVATPTEKHRLSVLYATDEENAAHERYITKMRERGKCLWPDKS